MNSFVIVTVVKADGSTPRAEGSKMIVHDDGRTLGTIGGGALEHQAIKDCADFLKLGKAGCREYPLGPALGQCCGGNVTLFFEPHRKPKKIVIFGAGHIAEELVPLLKKLGFHVALVDEREDRLGLPAFGVADERINELPIDALKTIDFNDDLHLIAITHQHKHDEKIVEFCLDKPFRYLGMIGSRTKWQKFKQRYRAKGFAAKQIARVKTPIGLDIGGDSPFEIAVSIVAELISLEYPKN